MSAIMAAAASVGRRRSAPLALNVLPTGVAGFCFTGPACQATSNQAVATASGGSGGYTYLWTKVSGSTIGITSSTSASTTFSNSTTTPWSTSSVYKCTVTDSLSATASDNVNVTLQGEDLS